MFGEVESKFVVKDLLSNMVCFMLLCPGFCLVSSFSGWSWCWAFCLSCDAWSFRWFCIGSISVSSCRCCMFVSVVHPVMILSAVFCVCWSLLVLVVDAMGDQIVLAYSMRGRVIALYVTVRVSFCFPKDDEVSAFRMLRDLSALSLASLMCSL